MQGKNLCLAFCIMVGCGMDPPESPPDDQGKEHVPNPPTGLMIVSHGSIVHLEWSDNSGVETGFVIQQRQLGAENFATIATIPKNVTSYTRTTVLGTYAYRVGA